MSTFRSIALIASTAHALTNSKKPFPKLRPLVAPRCAALQPVDDAFGIANEEAMLSAARKGQDSFDIDAGKTDPFGFVDEEKVRLLQEQKTQTSFAGVSKGALGFAEQGDSVPVTYATSTLKPAASAAVPFLDRPAVLDEIALPGDAGFDPLGLATDAEALIRMRDAELKHGRLAMLAAVGWPISELVQPQLASLWHEPSLVFKQGGEVPSVLNGGLGDVPIVFWAGAVSVAIMAELAGLQATNEGKMPGDLGLKADFGLSKALGNDLADAETYNGRLAMMAVTAYVVQEFAAKLGGLPEPVVSQSYGLFHPLFL